MDDARWTNRLCRLLGATVPVVQAPIGSATTPELAAAVSDAGGLGTLALTWDAPDAARAHIRATRQLTGRPGRREPRARLQRRTPARDLPRAGGPGGLHVLG